MLSAQLSHWEDDKGCSPENCGQCVARQVLPSTTNICRFAPVRIQRTLLGTRKLKTVPRHKPNRDRYTDGPTDRHTTPSLRNEA